MPQDIAAKKAWVKIYRRRGQRTKARQLEQEVRRLENPKPTTKAQTQHHLETKMAERLGRPLTSKERMQIIHGIWGRKGESVDDTRRRLGHDRNGYYITELFGMSEEEKRRWWRRHPNR